LAQVWSSPARVAAFARASRLFAATSTYRRSAIADARRSGAPLVRPVSVAFPELRQATVSGELLFGDSVLVAPVLRPGQDTVTVGLPPGVWVELFSGRRRVVTAPPPPPPGEVADPFPARRVRVPAPVGRPAVLYRPDDPDAASLRQALAQAGLLD
jgi:alpha-glucosidase